MFLSFQIFFWKMIFLSKSRNCLLHTALPNSCIILMPVKMMQVSQKWIHVDYFLSSFVLKISTRCFIFQKRVCFKNKHISFTNIIHFDPGQFLVHDVLENKYFCLCNKNSVLTVRSWKQYSEKAYVSVIINTLFSNHALTPFLWCIIEY